MTKPTILAVDDTIENLDVLETLLEEYRFLDATNGPDAIELAKTQPIDLILLDIMMPKMNGFEVAKILKSDEKTQDIPIIFLTARNDEKAIEKAYTLGAADYISKPFLPKELLARVKKELRIHALIQKLENLASRDELTQLYNRRFFYESANKMIEYAKRHNHPLSIIMLDIDHFKLVNDTFGHANGDLVLKSLSQTMEATQRKSDTIVRLGGEEFAILLPDTNEEQAIQIAEKLRHKIEQTPVNLTTDNEINYTISLGVSQINTLTDKNIDDSLQRADEALYRAKEKGRNNVQSTHFKS